MSNDVINYYLAMDLRGKTMSKNCLHFGCNNKSINAHSIQKQGVLSKISVDGQVVAFEYGSNGIDSIKKGKRQASTFTGFCGLHDNDLFTDIERRSYEIGNVRQETLFAYRALSRELHAKTSMRNFYSALLLDSTNYNKRVVGLILQGIAGGIADLERCRTVFKIMFETGDYTKLRTKIIVFDYECGIAVSSACTRVFDFTGNKIIEPNISTHPSLPPLIVSVFPQNGKTYVLLSYIVEDDSFYSFLDNQLLNKKPILQQNLLSKFIFESCENIFLSPQLWDKLSKKTKEEFENNLLKNIQRDLESFSYAKSPFNFFSPY